MNEGLNTLFILDWDDTLFPTTPFSQQKLSINQISTISIYIQKIINTCLRKGEVHIVTQGNIEWIYLCQLILRYNIPVPIHYVDPKGKKDDTFSELIKTYQPKNVITAGDSPYDYKASSAQRQLFPQLDIKHIGFKVQPDWEDWEEQIQKIYTIMPEIVQRCGHIDALFPNSHTFQTLPGKVTRWVITD